MREGAATAYQGTVTFSTVTNWTLVMVVIVRVQVQVVVEVGECMGCSVFLSHWVWAYKARQFKRGGSREGMMMRSASCITFFFFLV